jgi:Domain of unknown function (DUF4112)
MGHAIGWPQPCPIGKVDGEQCMLQFSKHPQASLTSLDQARLSRIRWLSYLLDERFRIPGTRQRIGLDGLLGILPGVGDTVGTLLSTYILFEAVQIGVPRSTLLRMIANIALDTVVGAVPVVGDIFDVAWKANKKNVALVNAYIASQAVENSSPV